MSQSGDRKNEIEFLVRRKFPPTVFSALPNQSQPKGATTVDRFIRHGEIDRYRYELQQLSSEQFQSLYDEEREKAFADQRREEEARFFNRPHAAADFGHWSKTEHWSLDEAIALILGKAPEIVSWPKLESLCQISPFVKQYARLRDLTQRAAAWKKLYDPVLPSLFLRWAKENDIDVPAELQQKVQKLKGKLVDWKESFERQKSAYDQLDAACDKWRLMYDEHVLMYKQHVADWKNIVEKRNRAVVDATKRIVDLEAQLVAIKDAKDASSETPRPQSPIERENMLKTIYVMATKGYGYASDNKRSTVVADIVNDLSLTGLPLSDDTIRRYLNEAREKLSEWQERSG